MPMETSSSTIRLLGGQALRLFIFIALISPIRSVSSPGMDSGNVELTRNCTAPIGWVLPSEIFNLSIRSKAISITTSATWMCNL